MFKFEVVNVIGSVITFEPIYKEIDTVTLKPKEGDINE